jgi:hypothetical protein
MYQTGLPAEIGPQVTIDLFICNGLLPKLMDNVFDTGEGERFNISPALLELCDWKPARFGGKTSMTGRP